MNIHLKRKLRILLEQTNNLNEFIDEIDKVHKISDELKSYIKKFIEESNCKKIQFSVFKPNMLAYGLAMHDGVLINKNVLNYELGMLLYTIFHETAHQYQYKKYGAEKIYDIYVGQMEDIVAAEIMLKIENVADRFAFIKINQLKKLGLIPKHFRCPQFYLNMKPNQVVGMVGKWRQELKKNNVKSPEEVSQYFYNLMQVVNTIQSIPNTKDEKLDERKYIDWNKNYGVSFKFTKTPEGKQNGVEWKPDLISIVTPENSDAWSEWEDIEQERLQNLKQNWDKIQKTLSDVKYRQILKNMP